LESTHAVDSNPQIVGCDDTARTRAREDLWIGFTGEPIPFLDRRVC